MGKTRKFKGKKKRGYGGVCAARKQKAEEEKTAVAVDEANLADAAAESEISAHTPLSSSERKISTVNISEESVCALETDEIRDGFILVDLKQLCGFLDSCVTCPICEGLMTTSVARSGQEGSNGFAHRLIGTCNRCKLSRSLFKTSNGCCNVELYENNKRPFEVNVRMTMFVRNLGLGHAALREFSEVLNSPPPIYQKAYDTLLGYQCVASEMVAQDSMKIAAAELKEDVGGDVSVSLDGTWQKRGFSSHNGVVTAISVDTGKCVDCEVLSNFCKGCQQWDGKDHRSEEYQTWKKEHDCQLNHTGSAGSMEASGAVRIFSRSVEKRGLRYVNYLGDGDSSSFSRVQNSAPYGEDISVQKLECVGHIQKRVGGRLRKLKANYRESSWLMGNPSVGLAA